jgi:hypothetical protein
MAMIVSKERRSILFYDYAVVGVIATGNHIRLPCTGEPDILACGNSPKGRIWQLIPPAEKPPRDETRPSLAGNSVLKFPEYKVSGGLRTLPVKPALGEEALEQAVEIDVTEPGQQPLKVRCLSAEHNIAIALHIGRPEDFARVRAFLKQGTADPARLKGILQRHDLMLAWKEFCAKSAINDSL